MTIKIGINGFGRIGRMVLRAAVQNFPTSRSSASTTCSSPTTWRTCSSTTRCTAASRAKIAVDGNTLVVNGKKIRLTAVKDPPS
jgi:glyceraldehyde 3-phosphate dehydrogenase